MTELVDLDEPGIGRLCHLNYLEFSRELARWSGPSGAIDEHGGAMMFATGTPFPVTCNGVARLDPTVAAARVIEAADEWFATHDRGYSALICGLEDVDADMALAAAEAGLLEISSSPAMVCARPLDPVVLPPGVELSWLGEDADVSDFVNICDASYQSLGMPADVIVELVRDPARVVEPHLRTVVARLEGQPVACAQLLLSHGIAGVYFVGTVEAARGRGLAELVTRAVTNLGFELGAPFVTLQASSMGESIYRRMGYVELYRYTTFTRFV
ncbi:hypothetical protein BH10ACT3_BH10ACT3_18810 [soil metagenome]